MPYLDGWSTLDESFSSSLMELSNGLLNVLSQVPLDGLVKADMKEIEEELHSALQATESICLQVQSFMPKIFDPLASLHSNLLQKPGYPSREAPSSMPYEIEVMGHAACLCLRKDPESRPSMSKVLRILEGGNTPMPLGLDLNSVGSQSGHLQGLRPRRQSEMRKCHSRKLSQ